MSSRLEELADLHGISPTYWSFYGVHEHVSEKTLIAVLEAMGVDAHTDESIEYEIEKAVQAPWKQTLPECTIHRQGTYNPVYVHVPHGQSVIVRIEAEDDTFYSLAQIDDFTSPREIEGVLTGQAAFMIGEDVPLGYHTLHARIGVSSWEEEGDDVYAPLIVVPQRIASPSQRGAQGWGMMAQLYSVRSCESWGIGDVADLRELCSYVGSRGGDFLLINPLHAAEPVGHMTPSPYLPVTRRFFNPIYIRPEDIPTVAYMSPETRELVRVAAAKMKEENTHADRIDRDGVWKAKSAALEVIFQEEKSPARARAFRAFREKEGQGLEDFALWCALREQFGEDFPKDYQSPRSQASQEFARANSDRLTFYAWLQWVMDEQLAAAQREARESGMRIGITHDLAVGVHSQGSDTWSIPDAFAAGVSVGAPPDMYNQHGQNWSQPPWRPDTLKASAYAPLRDMARTVLRHAGALRIDHIMGLFRLWWIPEGAKPSEGAYVRYDHEAMVGVLLLEAERAGAVLVGEDLGNVEPWVRDFLKDRGILGTSVLWFEQEADGSFKHPDHFRHDVLVSVDTHDLPPLAGYLAGDHVKLREQLGLLTQPVEEVAREAEEEKIRMIDRLREYGFLGENCTEETVIEAMHRYIACVPAELLAIALVDAVGERRTQNQPGTNNEYPNWRIPLGDRDGVVLVEDLPNNRRCEALIAAVKDERAMHGLS